MYWAGKSILYSYKDIFVKLRQPREKARQCRASGIGFMVRFYVCPEGSSDLERLDSYGPRAYRVEHDANKMKNFWAGFVPRRLQVAEKKIEENGCSRRNQSKKHR